MTLSTSHSNLPSVASTPSPTTPVGVSRPPPGSPSGARSTLTTSRLSAGPGVLATPGGGARTGLIKQPLFQRPPGAAAPASAAKDPLSAIPGSPAFAPPSLDNYEIGDRVIVESMALSGYLRYLGSAEFKSGTWAGIELDTPTGKNDGSVNGYGLFVLAAKIAKSELLFPPELASGHSPSAQEDTSEPPTPTVNHAAQAASRISAGSRASRYIGMTASQLKQRNDVPQPSVPSTTSTPSTARNSLQGQSNLPGASGRASSPTIRTLSGISGSPTGPRTTTPGSTGVRGDSPSPVPKPLLRSASPTARLAAGNRLSQPTAKTTLTLSSKTAAHARSTSSTSSVTSQSSATSGARARTSPTPRTMTRPRGLSSRSEAPDASTLISLNDSRTNILDQAAVIQTSCSPRGNMLLQQQQHLDFETSVEESDIKFDMDETKSQLDTSGLLDKSLISEGIDESLVQELEELRAMKATWEKEKLAKDQEIKVVTEKMTQVWLDAARFQKEKATLVEKLRLAQENANAGVTLGSSTSVEQQTLIDSLQKSLQEADEKTLSLENKLQELTARAAEEEDKLIKANEDHRAVSEAKTTGLEAERDGLQAKSVELEVKLKGAQEEALETKTQLGDVQRKLDEEVEARRLSETEIVAKLRAAEVQAQESQNHFIKSEKQVRGLEDKVKEFETTITKRDQEIAGLKLELQDIAGMVQSEEVDRMRKVWELEKKRLEEAVTDNITELLAKIKGLEASEASLKELTTAAQQVAREAEEKFAQERSVLEAKIAESEATLESRLSETNEKMDELEAIALTVEEWRERCEAMQLEMIQKTAAVEDLGLKLADAQAQEDTLMQEIEGVKKQLKEKSVADQTAALENSRAETVSLEEEREQLLVKVSELEAALTLSASAPRVSASGSADTETVLDRAELEEEIAALKQMVHELTAENATVASDNKKLMQEHDILMEAHKHVETECLKLMDEVERLHAESLAVASMGESDSVDKSGMDMVHLKTEEKAPRIGQEELKAALDNVTALSKDASTEKQSGQNQSASVIRLENMLKEKQTTLDRLTQAHALEMRDLRQRYVELDRTKTQEISQLNKELTDLESLIESKIFHEADLEETVQKKHKQIDRLQQEVSDLKNQLVKLTNGTPGSAADFLPNGLPSTSHSPPSESNGATKTPATSNRTRTESTDKILFCEICEKEGHDIINCVATFGGGKSAGTSATPIFANENLDDGRVYCENCEEYDLHYTDECTNESLTY
ncbi:CAP-GLY domain-containing linker protein 1 [Modicella reniformis]|uniref:CAP-GLY domain-containing linker protein 1 n=1 Tax=Modicella reniformis TaxID=1440133 RepID=A0A9P6SM77_9FUNG|nr:CAP-GLY domain-containing linker protein 1 [Modicella reniformis]